MSGDLRPAAFDVKKAFPALYAPTAGVMAVVEVPEQHFLMIDGHGDPNASPAYADAVEALYSLSYAVRSVAKERLRRVHTVAPLEGLWSAQDPSAFVRGDKAAWDWTMMISQLEWIDAGIVDEATARARKKGLAAVGLARFDVLAEGTSVQVLHIGPYDEEGHVIARMHEEFIPGHGYIVRGRHHEVYLSDARRTDPAKLRTILRQPVAPAP